ncbi:MAG TPA: divalent-cation tolerance protein CutA [Ilumatobacter sp.]|nr:divalent-cation tolerance protein CutA [Ilumatobacter sp.]
MTADLCEVVITALDAGWLVDFTRRLVEDRLAASAQVTEPVRSIYRWQDEVVDRTEARAMVRTRVRLVPLLVARLAREHPYEGPGIIAVPIISTSPTYKDWLLSQTSDAGGNID